MVSLQKYGLKPGVDVLKINFRIPKKGNEKFKKKGYVADLRKNGMVRCTGVVVVNGKKQVDEKLKEFLIANKGHCPFSFGALSGWAKLMATYHFGKSRNEGGWKKVIYRDDKNCQHYRNLKEQAEEKRPEKKRKRNELQGKKTPPRGSRKRNWKKRKVDVVDKNISDGESMKVQPMATSSQEESVEEDKVESNMAFKLEGKEFLHMQYVTTHDTEKLDFKSLDSFKLEFGTPSEDEELSPRDFDSENWGEGLLDDFMPSCGSQESSDGELMNSIPTPQELY